MDEKTIKTFKEITTPPHAEKGEKQRFLRLRYFDFIKAMGWENSVKSYREYRALCRGVWALDLQVTRPRREVKPIESQLDLFGEAV